MDRSAARAAFRPSIAADRIPPAYPQTGPLARAFRGEKRFKYFLAVFGGYARAKIFHLNLHILSRWDHRTVALLRLVKGFRLRADDNIDPLDHCIARIHHKVH